MAVAIHGPCAAKPIHGALARSRQRIGQGARRRSHRFSRALQINPKHRGVHEYLGEAYLQVGKLSQAEEQLKALDKICFLPCEQYSELKEHIADYKRALPTRAAL